MLLLCGVSSSVRVREHLQFLFRRLTAAPLALLPLRPALTTIWVHAVPALLLLLLLVLLLFVLMEVAVASAGAVAVALPSAVSTQASHISRELLLLILLMLLLLPAVVVSSFDVMLLLLLLALWLQLLGILHLLILSASVFFWLFLLLWILWASVVFWLFLLLWLQLLGLLQLRMRPTLLLLLSKHLKQPLLLRQVPPSVLSTAPLKQLKQPLLLLLRLLLHAASYLPRGLLVLMLPLLLLQRLPLLWLQLLGLLMLLSSSEVRCRWC